MKKLVGIVIALVVLLVGGAGVLHMLIDQKAVRQHVAEAVQRETGLELRMERAGFQLLPWPSFHAESITLRRPGCAPFMTAQTVHADISLLALLHRELSFQDFTANGAWMSFHHPAAGDSACSSWPPFPVPASVVASGKPVAGTPARHWSVGQRVPAQWTISFDALHLGDARILWQDDTAEPKGKATAGAMMVSSLDLAGLRSHEPWVDLHALYDQTPFTLRGHVGNLSRLFRSSHKGERPWVFSVGMTIGENPDQTHQIQARLTLDGAMMAPHHLRGVQVSVQGQWPSMEKGQGIGTVLFPTVPWASISGLHGAVTLRDDNTRANEKEPTTFMAAFRTLPSRLYPTVLHMQAASVGFSNDESRWHGLVRSSDVRLDAAGLHLPLVMQGTLFWGRYVWRGMADLGPLDDVVAAWRMPTRHPAIPVSLSLQGRAPGTPLFQGGHVPDTAGMDNASFHLSGVLEQAGGHFTLDGSAQRMELPKFSARQSRGAELHHLTVRAGLMLALSEQAGPSFSLSDAVVESDELGLHGDGGGDGHRGKAYGLRGQFRIEHADMDSLLKPWLARQAEVMPLADADSKIQSNSASDQDIAAIRNALQRWGWDILMTGRNIHYDGLLYNDVVLTSTTEQQTLHTTLTGTWATPPASNQHRIGIAADITPHGSNALSVHVDADAPGGGLFLPASWVTHLFGWPDYLGGLVQLVGTLNAEGDTAAALRASVSGHVGVILVDGTMNSGLLAPLAGPAAALLKLGSGTLPLRCLAGLAYAQQGQVTLDQLTLQAGRFVVTGGGAVSLPEGTMQLQLHPYVRVGGEIFAAPMQVSGPFLDPSVSPMHESDGSHSLTIGPSSPEVNDPCTVAVEKVRGGHEGPSLPSQNASVHTGSFLRALGLEGK